METVQTVEHPTFETVWAGLQEVRQILKENAEARRETDRIVKENAERQKELTESQKETDRQMKETDRIFKEQKKDFDTRLGGYVNIFGEVTEYLMAPKLREQFRELGLDFPQASRNVKVNDLVNGLSFETDVKLENGDKAMLVEVKTKLTVERIDKHIERLEKMRMYANLHGDKRTFLGAVAGVVVTDEARNYALNQGFFVIEPLGENLNITPPNGKPKEF
jgi:hypothetical protein